MVVPSLYGTFHLIAIGAVLIITVLFAGLLRNKSGKTMRAILIVLSVLMLLVEAYIIFSNSYDTITNTMEFNWSFFPWTLPVVSALIMLLAGVVKEGKFQRGLLMFLGTFSLFAGGYILFYPAQLMTSNIVLNICQMFLYGFMFVTGVYLWAAGKVKFSMARFGGAVIVFIIVVALAIGLNTLMNQTGWNGMYDFNMLGISQYYYSTIPYLSIIQDVSPWLAIAAYAGAFIVLAFIVMLFGLIIQKLSKPNTVT